MKQNQKGFTLIEVLIVVVIIAVLASLILPRMTGQTERAVIAEAQQMLGALRRGQQQWMDMTGTTAGVGLGTACGHTACTAADTPKWAKIGVTPPDATGSYNYTCDSDSCTATRIGGSYANATIKLQYKAVTGINDGVFTCSGTGAAKYANILDTDNNRGCSA